MRANLKLPGAFLHVSSILLQKWFTLPFCGYRWSTDLIQVACNRGLAELEAAMQIGEEKKFDCLVLPGLCDRQAWEEDTQRRYYFMLLANSYSLLVQILSFDLIEITHTSLNHWFQDKKVKCSNSSASPKVSLLHILILCMWLFLALFPVHTCRGLVLYQLLATGLQILHVLWV